MYCKSCGKQIDDDSAYCRYCGAVQSVADTADTSDTGDDSASPPAQEAQMHQVYQVSSAPKGSQVVQTDVGYFFRGCFRFIFWATIVLFVLFLLILVLGGIMGTH